MIFILKPLRHQLDLIAIAILELVYELLYFRININAILLIGYVFFNDIEAFFIEITIHVIANMVFIQS